MATRPGYVWSGTEWIAIGQEAAVAPVSYQATAPSSPATGDIWIESDVDVPSIDSAQFLRWRKTMTGGETSLSGNDDSSLPLRYTPGYEQLYINGVLQVRGGDYTATTGTTVTGLTALLANDVVEIFSAVARTVADVYTQTQSDARFVNRNVGGLNLVIPTSVTGGTLSANGLITMTSSSSVSVNNVFSSAYINYRIDINITSSSGGFDPLLSLQSSASSHDWRKNQNETVSTGSNASSWNFMRQASGGASCVVDIMSPNLNSATFGLSRFADNDTFFGYSSLRRSTSVETGFNITFQGATGTIRIYGYNNGA